MKVLILFALVAFAAAEAEPEPEADPQLLLNNRFPIAPMMSIKSEDGKPITYTIPSTGYPYGAFPYSAYPYTHSNFNTWPYLLPQVGKTAESARAKRDAEAEADPQFMFNPMTYSFGGASGFPRGAFPYSAYPYSAYPYTHSNFNTWPYLLPQVGKPAESARAKRDAEAEADPQFMFNPMTYSFGGASGFPAINPLTYSAGAWPAASWSGAWPSTWSGASWPYNNLPIGYALAKKTE